MLEIIIPASEGFDSRTNTFVEYKEVKLTMEHSLISLSKWESKYNKPFLSSQKTSWEMLDYIRFMTITSNVSDDVFFRLTNENIIEIQKYIEAPMTATTITNEKKGKKNHEVVTSEIIYYWMITLNIPVEFQKWHLNRLLTLIEVCSIKNEPPKKESAREIAMRNRAINEMNRKRFKTKG